MAAAAGVREGTYRLRWTQVGAAHLPRHQPRSAPRQHRPGQHEEPFTQPAGATRRESRPARSTANASARCLGGSSAISANYYSCAALVRSVGAKGTPTGHRNTHERSREKPLPPARRLKNRRHVFTRPLYHGAARSSGHVGYGASSCRRHSSLSEGNSLLSLSWRIPQL